MRNRPMRNQPMLSLHPLRGPVLDALAVLFPVTCAGCGREDRALCTQCRAQLHVDSVHRQTVDGIDVVSALEYQGVTRRALLAFKEADRTDIARVFAPAFRLAVEQAALGQPELDDHTAGPVNLCPVPSAPASWRRRGFSPVEVLLGASGLRGLRVLRHRPGGERQKTLSIEARWRNLEGSFVARSRLDGRRFVLVDDVVTTGATISQAVRAIRDAGGTVVAAATLAHTARRMPSTGQPHRPQA